MLTRKMSLTVCLHIYEGSPGFERRGKREKRKETTTAFTTATMSAEYATHRFFRASRQDPSQETWLERLMRDKLPEIAGSVPESRLAGICLLEDLGEFLTRLAHVSAEFAKTVVNGPIVSDYADDRINEDEFRDLEVVVYLDDKHMSLK